MSLFSCVTYKTKQSKLKLFAKSVSLYRLLKILIPTCNFTTRYGVDKQVPASWVLHTFNYFI